MVGQRSIEQRFNGARIKTRMGGYDACIVSIEDGHYTVLTPGAGYINLALRGLGQRPYARIIRVYDGVDMVKAARATSGLGRREVAIGNLEKVCKRLDSIFLNQE